MRRILFKPIVVYCCMGCIASAGLWIRSYRYWDGFHVVWSNGNQLGIDTSFGAFGFRFFRLQEGFSFSGVEITKWGSRSIAGARPMRGDRYASFDWTRTTPSPLLQRGYTQMTQLHVPYWGVFTLCLTGLLVTFVRAYRRLQQSTVNICVQCGYNLTGNVSGICPECGNEITAE